MHSLDKVLMHWNSLQDFFAMGGYAFFVWSSVGATVLSLGAELLLLRARRARLPSASPTSDFK
jgi:heme exporter protein D